MRLIGIRCTRSRKSIGLAVAGPEVEAETGGLATGLPPNNAPSPRPKAGFAIPAECPNPFPLSIPALFLLIFIDSGLRIAYSTTDSVLSPSRFCLYPSLVDHKNPVIAAILADCRGRDLDEHYLAFFECFNRQFYYEAHEV